jgi:hypothetical protein
MFIACIEGQNISLCKTDNRASTKFSMPLVGEFGLSRPIPGLHRHLVQKGKLTFRKLEKLDARNNNSVIRLQRKKSKKGKRFLS